MSRPGHPPLNAVAWDDDPALPDWPGLPLLQGPVSADACVVGLGGSGLAAVEELADQGLSVVGIDAGRVAAGAAGRNGGILSAGGALLRTDGTVGPQLRRDLYLACAAELARLSEQLGDRVVKRVGVLRVAGLPGEDEDRAESVDRVRELLAVETEADALRSWGVPVETYEGVLGRGYYNPTTAAMNPVHRAYGLALRLEPRARLFEHTPATAVHAGGVETPYGSIHAPFVVVAVDGRLPQLVPQLAQVVRTVRLQMLATAPVARRRLPCPASFRHGFDWAQQDEAGRLFVGGGRDKFLAQEFTTDDQPTPPVQTWIASAAARIAAQPVTVTHRWAASVGYTEDRRVPVVLIDDGVAVCGGYSGSGNLVGPVAARAAVALAVHGTPPPDYFRTAV